MKKRLLFCLLGISLFPSTQAQKMIPLYSGKAPGSESWTWQEGLNTQNPFQTPVAYNVVDPSLTAYFPAPDKATGTAVIIAPGGAFHTLSVESEGSKVAEWLAQRGIAAFVLKYRLVRSLTDQPVQELLAKMNDFKKLDEINAPVVKLAVADGLQATRIVRQNAKAWGIDPTKIGFMGFSAGGTVTASVALSSDQASRPNFIAPIYLYGGAVLGNSIPTTPMPMFVAVAADDELGLMPHSLRIYEQWIQAKQPAELHVYPKGGHGFGMHQKNITTDTWIERFAEWMKQEGVWTPKPDPGAEYRALVDARNKVDYAYLERYASENQNLPKPVPGQKRVILYGDSITELWVKLRPDFFQKNQFIGRGISGQTTAQALLRFRQDVIDLRPTTVVITLGTNDVAENTGPFRFDYTIGNLQTMIEMAQAQGINVILTSILPADHFNWRPSIVDPASKISALNEALKRLAADKKVVYLDYHTSLKTTTGGLPLSLAPDGVHPNEAGYVKMEQILGNQLSLK